MTVSSSFGVRKGAWTEEEDGLLRKCVEKYGEAKWHQVPFRAGLNRCRKSCRLRWLNYLKPTIKRGEFTEDEVDLMLRLQKLLGNRWSLIAGRLPGRTANDVKNYWNSNIRKRIGNSCNKILKPKAQNQKTGKVNIIKPQPRTFSRNSTWFKGTTTISNNLKYEDHILSKPSIPLEHSKQETETETEIETARWENLLCGNNQFHQGITTSMGWSEEKSSANLFGEKSYPGTKSKETFGQVEQSYAADDFYFDVELWDLLNADQGSLI